MIEIYAVGGYNEVGKNCTAVNVDGESLIIDLGIHLENYIKLTEDEDIIKISADKLIDVGAVPDISVLDKIKKDVKAIVISHAHLDHVGAVPYIANKFNAPVICTPYTAGIINGILKEDNLRLRNEIKTVNLNSFYKVTDNITIEFVYITHSIPQSTLVAIHTKYGIILYANDFKLDLHPTLGRQPNFKRLEELGKEGVIALIVESTYANDAKKMPSESVAREMLKDVLLGIDNKNNTIIVTTFSSHLARLKSIMEFGKKLNRKVLFLGRSLAKYIKAGEELGIISFSKEAEIVKYGQQIKDKLKKINAERKKYLLVTTGHQGEPKSVLCKIARGEINFKLYPEDNIIFSCRTIPTPTNIANREALENELKLLGVRIFKDIHQSGHAAREDLRDIINWLKPRVIIPAHGTLKMKDALADLGVEMGYKMGESILLIRDGHKVEL
ncbi:RNase J family beta-CASP ribonuclease [Candidatus Woesearchaeota archaeon]|nr:RNase J family beta-CASP ribonuclease [Candidatus Woesearchaeota archaeon]